MLNFGLLDPNNRLLGWSANYVSLYGGQPTITLGMPRADEAGGAFVSVPSPLPSASAPIRDAIDLDAAPVQTGGIEGGATDLAPNSFHHAQANVPTTVAAPLATTAPAVPDPVGSGSLAPSGLTSPFAAASEGDGNAALQTVSPFTAPVLDLASPAAPVDGVAVAAIPGLIAPVLDLAAPTGTLVAASAVSALDTVAVTGETVAALLDGLTDTLPLDTVVATLASATDGLDTSVSAAGTATTAATDALGDVTALAGESLAGVTDTLGEVTTGVDDTIAQTAAHAANDLAATIATVIDTAADVAATAGQAVADTTATAVDTAGDTAGTTGQTAADAISTVTSTAGDVAMTTGQTVAETTDVATDTVADVAGSITDTVGTAAGLTLDTNVLALGGSDPDAGVATLVGMVESADLFDLSQAGTNPAPITEGGSILDVLAADEAPGALLGVDGEGIDTLVGLGHHDNYDGGLLGGL